MFRKIILHTFLVLCGMNFSIFAQEKTIVNDMKAQNMLLGKHLLSLQWISWDYFGSATIANRKGVYYLKGGQRQRGGIDFLEVDGAVTEINAKNFKFDGKIMMQISHINSGKPYVRQG